MSVSIGQLGDRTLCIHIIMILSSQIGLNRNTNASQAGDYLNSGALKHGRTLRHLRRTAMDPEELVELVEELVERCTMPKFGLTLRRTKIGQTKALFTKVENFSHFFRSEKL